jgi:hypothetical protein
MSNILQTLTYKAQKEYIESFEQQYGITFTPEEKEKILQNLNEYRIIQEKIKKLEEEIQKEIQ